MRNFTRTTILLCLAGIFLVGAATGAVTALGIKQTKTEKKMTMENMEDSILAWAEKRLELSPEQVVRIRPLIKLAVDEYRAEQRQTVQRVIEIIRTSNRRIASQLEPSQVEKLMEEERKHEAYLQSKLKVEPPSRP